MIKITIIALSILFSSAYSLPKVDSLLNKLDERFNMSNDIKADINMTQQKPGQGTKKFEMEYYRRDSDNSFLIVMTKPESEKGNGYLKIADNFWMYRRNTRTFQHINRDESIGGSNAKSGDFGGRKYSEMYTAAKDINGLDIINEDTLGKIPVYRFEVKAKIKDVDYPKKIYWLRKDSFLILKEASYSSSGSLMETMYNTKYTETRGRMIPVQQLFVDEFEKGNKTILEIKGVSVDKLDDFIFTKEFLEKLNN